MSKSNQNKRNRESGDSDSDQDQSSSKKINADDKVWLENLTERQREAELLKRHEEREALKHREEIRKKLRSKNEEPKLSDDDTDNEIKPKSTTYDNDIYAEDDDDDDYRSSTIRRKQVNASKQKDTQHSRSLQALLEERNKKKQGSTSNSVNKSARKSDNLSSSDDDSHEEPSKLNKKEKLKVHEVYQTSSSSDDDDDDDDDDENRPRRRSRSPDERDKDSQEQQEAKRKKCTPITTKSQLKSMVLSRFRMEKWCHAPFFANVAKGAFVRINIGQNNGTPIYRVCEIRDVVQTGKIYNLGSTRTNKGLRLKHGNNERIFRLEYVSNSEISDSEFKRWREATLKQGIPLPTLEDVDNKIKAIDKCKHYAYSNNDITKIVEEKNRFRKAPINYAMKKNDLLKDIEVAKDEKDMQKEAELRKTLNEMEERASELDRKRSENISIITQINQRNRKRTQQNVEKALVREAHEHRNVAADPFTRRRCQPTLGSKAPPTKDELIRELHQRRAAEEAAIAKKKLEEQRLLEEKNNALQTKTTTEVSNTTQILPDKNLSTMTTHERGSFTSLIEKNDELFSSHDFELEFNIKVFPE